jgi:hypothetical protein
VGETLQKFNMNTVIETDEIPVMHHLLKRLLKVIQVSLLHSSRNVSKMKQNSIIYYSTMWLWSKYEVGS